MRKSSTLLLIAVIAVVVAAGIFALTKKSVNNSAQNQPEMANVDADITEPPATDNSNSQNQATTDTSNAEEATITYSNDCFSPGTMTVKAGTKVTVKNNSSRAIQFDSDPHPAHTDNRELNVDTIAAGRSDSFIATRTGTFGYHNHLNPSETGSITVQ